MDWYEEYKKKLTTPEEAVKIVKNGDVVVIGPPVEPKVLPKALVERRDELRNVTVITLASIMDPGWYSPGYPESFRMIEWILTGDMARKAMDEKRAEFLPSTFSIQFKAFDERPEEKREIDVFLTVVSPPNKHGYCSFGGELWNKRSLARRAKKILAEVDERQIRPYGDNTIHVSEIDYFVEYTPSAIQDAEIPEIVSPIKDVKIRQRVYELLCLIDPVKRPDLAPRLIHLANTNPKWIEIVRKTYGIGEPEKEVIQIAEHVSTLIKDGDTFQLGVRQPSGWFPRLGVFNNKNDLGYHGEMSARGVINLVKEGVINGRFKTIHRGKAVFSSLSGADAQEFSFADENPLIEVYDSEYVVNIKTISSHDNMVSINNALSVDLTGQINAESLFGGRQWSGPGGQPEFHIGAILSKGGRAITVLRSTALDGSVSRIVPLLEEGSIVTIPRYFSDYIVTEYGIARLLGKSCRERAEELIAISHPDFRNELRKEAKRLFY
jgi:4-hydroxybutyrate CoA-transferase